MSIPHRPRRRPLRRAAIRCPDTGEYVFTVAYSDDVAVTVWAFTALDDAERMFLLLKSRAMRHNGDVRIHMGYTHLNCVEPQKHEYPGDHG